MPKNLHRKQVPEVFNAQNVAEGQTELTTEEVVETQTAGPPC